MAKLMDAGVDYFRATTRDASIGADWAESMELVAAESRGYGILPTARGWLGYNGRLIGKTFLGARSDGWMAQVSGGEAHARWSDFMPARANITRIDCQVTCKIAMPCEIYLSQLWTALCHKKQEAGRAKKLACFSERHGVTGIAIGSRSSQCYIRIYDKGFEQEMKEVRDLLRWEVEAKDTFATTLAYLLESGSDLRESAISVVRTVCEKSGVSVPLVETYEKQDLAAPALTPSVFTQLRWLRDGVSPTVRRLIDLVGLQTVMQAVFFGTDGYLRKEDLALQLALLADDDAGQG